MTEQEFYQLVTGTEIPARARSYLDSAKRNRDGPLVRNLLQHYAVVATEDTKALLVEFCTGAGKTRVAADLIHRNGGLWLVYHEMVNHKDNLIEDFVKWHGEDILKHIVFTTYRSAHKHARKRYDGIILDEAHHVTPNNVGYIASVKATYHLFMSATVPPDKRLLLRNIAKFTVLKLTLKQAETWGILPTITYLLVGIQANMHDRDLTYHFRKSKTERAATMNFAQFAAQRVKPHNVKVLCTEYEYAQMYTMEIASWMATARAAEEKGRNADTIYATIVKPLGLRRKIFYSSIKIRELFTTSFIRLLKSRRSVIFGDRVDHIEELPFLTLHSGNKRKDNQQLVIDFNEGKIDQIAAVNMLNESMNLRNIELGVIMTLTKKNDVANIQRQGRLVRGKEPIIIVPYVKGTTDEKHVRKYFSTYKTKSFKTVGKMLHHVKENL